MNRRRGSCVIVICNDKVPEGFAVVHELRKEGHKAELLYFFGEHKSLKSLMRIADRLNMLDVVVLGNAEFETRKFKVRDMETGETEEFDLSKLSEVLKDRNAYEKKPSALNL